MVEIFSASFSHGGSRQAAFFFKNEILKKQLDKKLMTEIFSAGFSHGGSRSDGKYRLK